MCMVLLSWAGFNCAENLPLPFVTKSGGHMSSKQAAESFYSDDWKAFILDKYGAAPSLTYFISPVVVDNFIGEIISE